MLTQQELIERLTELMGGESTTTQTLRNREKQELTTPSYKGIGTRPGRSVFYPDKCLFENYAAGKMLKSQRLRLTAKEVSAARKLALELETIDENSLRELIKLPEHESLTLRLAEYWNAYFLHAKDGASVKWAISVCFVKEHSHYNNDYDSLEIIYSYQAVTKNILTGNVNCTQGNRLYIDVVDGRRWEDKYIEIDVNKENIVYIEVEDKDDELLNCPF